MSDSCDPVAWSPPGFSVRGIFQGRILEQGAISFSRGIFRTQEWNPGLLHCRLIPALEADSLLTVTREVRTYLGIILYNGRRAFVGSAKAPQVIREYLGE